MARIEFEGDSFRIMQFTDTHITDYEDKERRTFDLIRDLIAAQQPDFVIFTGDNVTAGEHGEPLFAELCETLETFKKPWSFVIGNHDRGFEPGGIHEKALEACSCCLFERGPENVQGTGNYAVELFNRGRPSWVFWGLDSNDHRVYNYNGNALRKDDYISRSQINWYIEKSGEIEKEYGLLPAFAFFHIPLPEYNDVWMFSECIGERHEKVYCPPVNSGFFHAAFERGDIRGMFCGHDHINSYHGDYMGITLAYGRNSGYHCK